MASRWAAPTIGDGASSMTFWRRRCAVQSRSPRCTTWPCASAKICTSTWRACSTSRSSIRRASPNADADSRRAPSSAAASSSAPRTSRMPRPRASRDRLYEQRVAHGGRLGRQARIVRVLAEVTRQARHTRLGHAAFRDCLVAHGLDRRRRGADEHQPGRAAGARECGVFAQETVARVHRVRAAAGVPPRSVRRCAGRTRPPAPARSPRPASAWRTCGASASAAL